MPVAQAGVRLPRLFSDNMVLQQKTRAPIWGWADPGEKVTVTLGKRSAQVTANDNGKWMVKLATPGAGGPYELVASGKTTVTVKNVLVGEVWLAAGQSNMWYQLENTTAGKDDIPRADYPQIRILMGRNEYSSTPLTDMAGEWKECTPASAPKFAAVSYYFARELHENLKVPIGIVNIAADGTGIESWVSKESLLKFPATKAHLENWERRMATYPNDRAAYDAAVKADPAYSKTHEAPLNPVSRFGETVTYQTQLLPVVPFALKGFTWYQGEHDVGEHEMYRNLLPVLVQEFRGLWHENLPFYSVQIVRFGKKDSELKGGEFRQAQTALLALPNTGLAIGIDTGNPIDAHKGDKRPIGHRLAVLALAETYHRDIVYSGPRFKSMRVEGKRIRVKFKDVDGGLVVHDDKLLGFAIAGEDKKWVEADATLDGDSVVVTSDKVPQPVAVRYGWGDFPDAGLYNSAGLPAAPFNSDYR